MESKFDLNSNLDYVLNNKVDTSKADEQDTILNSEKFNNTFQTIEDSLNLLYEKTRTIQDIIEYANSFIKNEIDESVLECRNLLKDIENNRDLLKDSAYINYNVKLQSVFDTYSDRDNSSIKGVEYHNGTIGLNNSQIEDMEIGSAVVESKNKNNNVQNTINSLEEDKSYRTFYMFDRVQSSPVQERIVINLPKVKTVNKINLTSSNCVIKSVEYILSNGNTEVVTDYSTNLTKNRDIKALAINIESSNYIISQVNYNDVKDSDFWSTVEMIKADDASIIDKKKYYYYLFGLDNISIQFVSKENKSCFVSKEIKLDSLGDQGYISLESEYSCEQGNIEFSIIDGTTEKDIIPESESQIIQEKIFHKIGTRFIVDTSKDIKIYKNGILTNTTLNAAINDPDEGYTVTYTPLNGNTIDSLLNNSIKVKAVIRNYDDEYIPFIKNIIIKKYGGGVLWMDKITT